MRRNQRGSGLIEGAVGLVIVMTGSIAGTLLLINSGTSMMFRTKLMLVSAQAAQYAAAHQSDSGFESETQSFVQSLMQSVGVSANHLTVTATPSTINGAEGVQVTVSNQFPLFTNGMLPDHLQLSDTEFASHTFSSSN